MNTTKKLMREILQLRASERFILIEALITSLDVPDSQIWEVWLQEAEKRLDAYKAGKLKTISFDYMFGEGAA
jgi:putative addiction module component (TIGR02574 family)